MQEVDDASQEGEKQQTQYDHHYDHPAAFNCTQKQTSAVKVSVQILFVCLNNHKWVRFFVFFFTTKTDQMCIFTTQSFRKNLFSNVSYVIVCCFVHLVSLCEGSRWCTRL